jgi:hypothetical protein
MNTCNKENCPLYSGKMTGPSAFLFNESAWDGLVAEEVAFETDYNACICFQLVYMPYHRKAVCKLINCCFYKPLLILHQVP